MNISTINYMHDLLVKEMNDAATKHNENIKEYEREKRCFESHLPILKIMFSDKDLFDMNNDLERKHYEILQKSLAKYMDAKNILEDFETHKW